MEADPHLETVRRLNLSFFELSNGTTRDRVIELLAHQRRHGHATPEEVTNAIEFVRETMKP